MGQVEWPFVCLFRHRYWHKPFAQYRRTFLTLLAYPSHITGLPFRTLLAYPSHNCSHVTGLPLHTLLSYPSHITGLTYTQLFTHFWLARHTIIDTSLADSFHNYSHVIGLPFTHYWLTLRTILAYNTLHTITHVWPAYPSNTTGLSFTHYWPTLHTIHYTTSADGVAGLGCTFERCTVYLSERTAGIFWSVSDSVDGSALWKNDAHPCSLDDLCFAQPFTIGWAPDIKRNWMNKWINYRAALRNVAEQGVDV